MVIVPSLLGMNERVSYDTARLLVPRVGWPRRGIQRR